MLRVIITSGGGPGVWGLLHALRTLPGRQAAVIVQDPHPGDTLGTLLGDERACLPPAADPAYIDYLLDYCRQCRADVLIPVYDGELRAIARRRGEFAGAGITLILPTTQTVEACGDKWSLHERLAGSDLLPPHRLVRTTRETAEAIDQLGYPQRRLCVRPIDLAGGRGVHFLDPAADRFARQMLAKPGPIECTASDFLEVRRCGPADFPLVIAEYLPGDDLGIDVLADDGRIVEMVVRRKGGSLHAGNPMRMTFDERSGEREWVARVCSELGLSGLVNIDARYDAGGRLRLLEINPRPSACIGMSCAVVHLLAWTIDRALGEEAEPAAYRAAGPATAVVRAIADVALSAAGVRILQPTPAVPPSDRPSIHAGERASVPASLLPVGNREYRHRLETGATTAEHRHRLETGATAAEHRQRLETGATKTMEPRHASAVPGRAS